MVLTEIYDVLKEIYDGINTLDKIREMKMFYPKLSETFEKWIIHYWNLNRPDYSKNDIIFDMNNEKDYYKAVIYFIACMTDNFAISMYNEIIGF